MFDTTKGDLDVASLCINDKLASCTKEEMQGGDVCSKEVDATAEATSVERRKSLLGRMSFGLLGSEKTEQVQMGVDVKLKLRITQRNAIALKAEGIGTRVALRPPCARNRPIGGEGTAPIATLVPDSAMQLSAAATLQLPERSSLLEATPLRTCAAVAVAITEKASHETASTLSCPRLHDPSPSGKWVVDGANRVSPAELPAWSPQSRAGTRALAIVRKDMQDYQALRLMDDDVVNWSSGTSSYKLEWEGTQEVVAAGPLITLEVGKAGKAYVFEITAGTTFDLYELKRWGLRRAHVFYRITKLKQRSMADARGLVQRRVRREVFNGKTKQALRALYIPTGFYTVEDARKSTEFEEQRLPFWRPSLTAAKHVPGSGGAGFFEANVLMGRDEQVKAGTISGRPAQEVCTVRLRFTNEKKGKGDTGWADGTNVAWLSTPLPCAIESPHGGKKNAFVFSAAVKEARRQLIATLQQAEAVPPKNVFTSALEGDDPLAGIQTVERAGNRQNFSELALEAPFCLAWPASNEWKYKVKITVYQCVSSPCNSDETALPLTKEMAVKDLDAHAVQLDSLSQSTRAFSLSSIDAEMSEKGNGALQLKTHNGRGGSALAKSLGLTVAGFDKRSSAAPRVEFVFQKLQGAEPKAEEELERHGGAAAAPVPADAAKADSAPADATEEGAVVHELEALLGGAPALTEAAKETTGEASRSRGARGQSALQPEGAAEEGHAAAALAEAAEADGAAAAAAGSASHSAAGSAAEAPPALRGGEHERRQEVYVGLERAEAEAPALRTQMEADQMARWLASLDGRVRALKSRDERLARLHDERLPPAAHAEAQLRLAELGRLEQRVETLAAGFAAVMTGEWGDAGVSTALAARSPQLLPLQAEFRDFERDQRLRRDLERGRERQRALERYGRNASDLEREWWWNTKDPNDPKVSFLDRIKSYFGMESQQTAEQIAYLEAKKQGYHFPHWSDADGQCLVGVKPGFLQQCRSLEASAVFNKGGECIEAADCTCDKFDLRDNGSDEPVEGYRMQCEERMKDAIKGLPAGLSVLSYADPDRYVWKVGCYVPRKTSWFFGDRDDPSKSKCGCFLVDNTLTMSVADEHSGEVCSYTPSQADRKGVEAGIAQAEALPAKAVE